MQDYWTIADFHTVSFPVLNSTQIPFCGNTQPMFVGVLECEIQEPAPIAKAEKSQILHLTAPYSKVAQSLQNGARIFSSGTLNFVARWEKGQGIHTAQQLCPGMFLASTILGFPLLAALILDCAKLFPESSCNATALDNKPVNCIGLNPPWIV